MNVIYSYRIKQAMAIELLHNFNMKNKIVIYREVTYAVDMHRKAMQLVFITNTMFIIKTIVFI